MLAHFGNREGTLDKKARMRREMREAGAAAMQPPPQNFVAHQAPTQPRFVRQGVDTSGDGRENTFDPSQNAQVHHAAPPPEGRRERRHRERAEQRRAAASGAPPPHHQHQQPHPAGPGPAQDDAAMLREAFEAERHARRVLEEQLLAQQQHQPPQEQPQHWGPPQPAPQQQQQRRPPEMRAAAPAPRPVAVRGGAGGDMPGQGAYQSRTQYEDELRQQIEEKERRKAAELAKEREADRLAEERFNRQQAEIEAQLAAEANERGREEAAAAAARAAAAAAHAQPTGVGSRGEVLAATPLLSSLQSSSGSATSPRVSPSPGCFFPPRASANSASSFLRTLTIDSTECRVAVRNRRVSVLFPAAAYSS